MSESSTDTDTEPMLPVLQFNDLAAELSELREGQVFANSSAGAQILNAVPVLPNATGQNPTEDSEELQDVWQWVDEHVQAPIQNGNPSMDAGARNGLVIQELAPATSVRQQMPPHSTCTRRQQMPPHSTCTRRQQMPPHSSWQSASPYVLPHAPPPAQPAGERFVESAVNSTLPTLEPWPGAHEFHVTVRTPPAALYGRQQPCVFVSDTNKLYVDMNIAVTFAFRVSEGTDTSRLRVSALPVYPDMQHVNTPVRRCPTHRQPELDCNIGAGAFIDHVIRAEHDEAVYQEGGATKERRSVVVPFERPPPGTREYRVSYRFCCMNTCVGGINRRRLVVLFSLEDSRTGEALGRQTIEVKVCKCPHRDARTDRSRTQPKRRRAETTPDPAEPPARQPRSVGRLVIELDDVVEYDHVMAVLRSFRDARRRLAARPVSGDVRPSPSPSPVAAETIAEESDGTAEVQVSRRPTVPVIKTEAP